MRLLRFLTITLMCSALASLAIAQSPRMSAQGGSRSSASSSNKSSSDEDPCVQTDDRRYCWTVDPITGIRHTAVPDTTYLDLATRQTMPGRSLGLLHTGNLMSPHLVLDFFDRRDVHDFLFVNAYSLFAHRPEDVRIFNTRLPFTTAAYSTSGSSLQSNDHLKLDFAGNILPGFGIGTSLDYIYARGEYSSQATKPLKWTSYVYYDSDRYHATLTYNLSKLANQENGGITDRSYVLKPDSFPNGMAEPRTMPTNLVDTWNDMDTYNLHLNHNYDLGFWDERPSAQKPDSLIDHFTSVASIFHSVDIEHYKHIFRMEDGADQSDGHNFFSNHYIDSRVTLDSTSYTSFATYAGLRINEGFSRWSQFGLSAFVGYQHQTYTMMQDTLTPESRMFIDRHHYSDNVFVGGQLSRHQSRYLTFDVTARFGLLGDKLGDVDIDGTLQTVIPAGKDSITLQGSGYFRNRHVSYLMEHYFSNHFRWSETFSPEQRLHLAANLRYSLTGTEAKVGIEHISNYHYFDAADYLPRECTDQIEVFALEVKQRLHWRALHFDNRLLFQTSTHPSALPLPRISLESDLNLQFCIAHSLTTQLGIIGYYTQRYYAPTYQPALQQFAVQHDYECGGYPLFNAYVNCNLKRLKFFIMYSGLGTKAFSNNAFLMPYYPLQSTRLEYGVAFDLQN